MYSVMTVVGGDVVHACDEFSEQNPPLPPISTGWSPLKYYGTYGQNKVIINHSRHQFSCSRIHSDDPLGNVSDNFGCFCWAF